MNKIAVVSMIKNEEDIVESFVRHALQFADKIYIKDHKSSDRTREILDSLKDEGLNLEVSTFELDEFAMSEVITQLTNQAFDDGFDIVLPLDTDEFPILVNGNSNDLKKYLQNLDITKFYRIKKWITYKFADNNENEYALSRSLVRETDDALKSRLTKVFIGRNFWIKHKPSVKQGNHGLVFSDEKSNPPVDLDSIIYVHIPARSSNQLISKHTIQWINTMLGFSKYTWYASHCRGFAHRYVDDENVAKISLNGFVPADLSEYKNEASLRFSGGGGRNPAQKLFILAENLAKTLYRERILAKKEIVRIFYFFDGDVERSIQSLNSILSQTYEFKKIFIVLLTTKNIADLILSIKDHAKQITFVHRTELQNVLMKPEGSYIQFVLPGDKLNPEMLIDMLELAHSNFKPSIMISELNYPANFDRGLMPKELDFECPKDRLAEPVDGRNRILLPILKNKTMLTSSLSRIVCRQKIFENTVWISPTLNLIDVDKFCIESVAMLFVVNIFKKENVCLRLNEKLVERGAKDWTAADLQFYKNICDQILEKL